MPKRLRPFDIEPYFTLLGADAVMSYQEFFGVIRAIDACWMEASHLHQEKVAQQTKAKASKPPRKR